MKAIASRVKEDRKSREETQKDYAERTGLSQPFIAQVESGARGLGVDSFMKLCRALNWTPEYLYYGKGVRDMDERSRLEQELLSAFRRASIEDQKKIIGSVRGFVGEDPLGNDEAA